MLTIVMLLILLLLILKSKFLPGNIMALVPIAASLATGNGVMQTMRLARAESHLVAHNCPVQICGMTVLPGDLIHADCHGAVVIPAEAAPRLAEACRRVS